jgi:hypothetical protein
MRAADSYRQNGDARANIVRHVPSLVQSEKPDVLESTVSVELYTDA